VLKVSVKATATIETAKKSGRGNVMGENERVLEAVEWAAMIPSLYG
jgi:hypothetical protein